MMKPGTKLPPLPESHRQLIQSLKGMEMLTPAVVQRLRAAQLARSVIGQLRRPGLKE